MKFLGAVHVNTSYDIKHTYNFVSHIDNIFIFNKV